MRTSLTARLACSSLAAKRLKEVGPLSDSGDYLAPLSCLSVV